MSTIPCATERLWNWLGLWKCRRRLAACIGGIASVAWSLSAVLAAPPQSFPPAFAAAPQQASVVGQSPKLHSADNDQGPELPPPPTPRPAPPKIWTQPIQQAAYAEPQTTPALPNPLKKTETVPQRVSVLPIPSTKTDIVPNQVQTLNRDAAVRWALQFNPEIAAIRQQHGIAAASVVISNTYPFNPLFDNRVRGASGPESAGVTNRVDIESNLLLEVEVRGQKRLRQEGAAAGLSRTDSDIAFQELVLAVRAGRAYDTLLYRKEKLALAKTAVSLTKDAVDQVSKLVLGGRLRRPDEILIRSELNTFIAQENMAQAAIAPALSDLRRALGIVEGLAIADSLEAPAVHLDEKTLVSVAMLHRPDLQAREAATAEAEARLKLERANRYGNPIFGPSFGYDATRIDYFGGFVSLPIPVFNQRSGEILQREAERDRAVLELRQTEVGIVHDVEGAVHRLEAARLWAETYRTTVLPQLKSSLESMETLFKAGDAGVDVLRLLDVRRKLLAARDGYLDALWELRQAQADLAAAIGDPALLAPSLRGLCGGPATLPAP